MKRPRHLKDLPAKKAAAVEKRRLAKEAAEKARLEEFQRIEEHIRKHGVEPKIEEDPLDLTS